MKIILKLLRINELEVCIDFSDYSENQSKFDRKSKHNDIINILKNNNLNPITTDNKIIINNHITIYKLLYYLLLNDKYTKTSYLSFTKNVNKSYLLTEIRKLKNIDNVEFIKDIIDNHFDKFNNNFKIYHTSLKNFIFDLVSIENVEEYKYLTDANKFDLI
jgi:hypothetical protein